MTEIFCNMLNQSTKIGIIDVIRNKYISHMEQYNKRVLQYEYEYFTAKFYTEYYKILNQIK